VAALEMAGELAGDLRRLVAPQALAGVADLEVQPAAAGGGDAPVEDVLVERMDEAVAGGDGAVGQPPHPGVVEELPAVDELVAALLDVHGVGVQRRGDRRGRGLGADDTGGLEDLPLVRFEAVDLALDQLADALRHPELDLLGGRFEAPAAAALEQLSFGGQVVEGGDQEQRVAFGVAVQARRQDVGLGETRKALAEVLGDRVLVEVAERQVAAVGEGAVRGGSSSMPTATPSPSPAMRPSRV
jgi:hypothetical protein